MINTLCLNVDKCQHYDYLMYKHPNKHIREAISVALNHGWTLRSAGKSAHAWGRLFCPENSPNGCIVSVWSTPKVPEHHARHILQAIKSCPHLQ